MVRRKSKKLDYVTIKFDEKTAPVIKGRKGCGAYGDMNLKLVSVTRHKDYDFYSGKKRRKRK